MMQRVDVQGADVREEDSEKVEAQEAEAQEVCKYERAVDAFMEAMWEEEWAKGQLKELLAIDNYLNSKCEEVKKSFLYDIPIVSHSSTSECSTTVKRFLTSEFSVWRKEIAAEIERAAQNIVTAEAKRKNLVRKLPKCCQKGITSCRMCDFT